MAGINMGRAVRLTYVLSFITAALLSACSFGLLGQRQAELIEVARSERQWTGVAVSQEGRIFVNYPRWSDNVPTSVAELTPEGMVVPFPDEEWNTWSAAASPKEHFVCVQSVYVDADNYLWILDPANPKFGGVVRGGPKLLKVDLKTNQVVQKIYFDEAIAPQDSYLNDVRVDTKKGYAYLTESGTGALIVVHLPSGQVRRVLANDPLTKSENIAVIISGREWRRPDGSIPQVHADGIALDREGRYLYYHALTGTTLYRIETRWLRDAGLSEQQRGERVERLGATGPVDGMEFGLYGDDNLYLTSLEDKAVKRFTPRGQVEVVVQDFRLEWPDSFAWGPGGFLYVTTSQINRMPNPSEPFRLFKLKP